MIILSEKALALIIEFEVGGGKDYYDRHLSSPTWPGAASGVTVGLGYDCGYNIAVQIQNDWAGRIADAACRRLAECALIRGTAAAGLVHGLKDIVVGWDAALGVFRDVSAPKFSALTAKSFPGIENLPANAQGALVSLVFNRGNAMEGPRRAEMREIRKIIMEAETPVAIKLQRIAAQLRAMTRLWVGTAIERGMTRRRNAEAELVETQW